MIAIAACAILADAAVAGPGSTVALKATLSGRYLHTTSRGSGTVNITIGSTQVCWRFTFSGTDAPNISGIHQAPPPRAGYHKLSVLPFTATTKSDKRECEKLDRWGSLGPTWAKKIAANPSKFYVIIGTARYPNGAIGGVLRRA
jgi:hypothetical protein